MTRFTDEEVTAWLDGTAAPDLVARLEASSSDPDVAAQIAALSVSLSDLRAGFDALLEAAPDLPPAMSQPPARVSPSQIPPTRDKHRTGLGWPLTLIAASVSAFVLGLGTMRALQPADAPDWVERAVIYHTLYTAQTLAPFRPTPAKARQELAAMGQDLGVDLSAFVELDGLSYRRAQPLALDGKRIVQISYQDKDGKPFALCLKVDPDMSDVPVTETLSGLAASHGRGGDIGFLIVGGQDPAVTRRLAQVIDGQL